MKRLRLRRGVKAKPQNWLISNVSVRTQALGVSVSSCKMGMSLEGPEGEAMGSSQ